MKNKESSSPLLETARLTSKMWKSRPDITIPFINKTFRNYQKIPAIIKEVIDNLWRNEELKPLVIKKERKDNKYIFIIHLPPGVVSYNDFKSKENYFYDAVDGDVLIDRRGKSVILTVLEGTLKTKYPYEFNPEDYPKMFLPFPVGYNVNGLVVRDLARFPYLLIGGLPDYGKSNFIHVINTSLLIGRPDTSFIVTIDFKVSEYATYMNDNGLLVTDETNAYKSLQLLEGELEKRMNLCARLGKQKIHNIPLKNRPPWIVIEVDEITELQHKPSQESLNRIMRLGRAYGFCAITATQKPSARTFRNATFTETRSLCSARMCFNVMENEDSIMILENTRGTNLPTVSGRGIFKHIRDEVEVQTMYINPEIIPDILKDKGVNMNGGDTKWGQYGFKEYGFKEYGFKEYGFKEYGFRKDEELPKMLPPR